jgi:chromosome segregation protein
VHRATLVHASTRVRMEDERQREIEHLADALQALEDEAGLAHDALQAAETTASALQEQVNALRRDSQGLQAQVHAEQVEVLKLSQARSRWRRDLEDIAHLSRPATRPSI